MSEQYRTLLSLMPDEGGALFFYGIQERDKKNTTRTAVVDEIRWDEKAGLRRDAGGSQVIDALEAQEIKETGNEEG